eukprot:SAG11_NODE_5338_length_1590_cov_1.492958_4_plen_78_part_00
MGCEQEAAREAAGAKRLDYQLLQLSKLPKAVHDAYEELFGMGRRYVGVKRRVLVLKPRGLMRHFPSSALLRYPTADP